MGLGGGGRAAGRHTGLDQAALSSGPCSAHWWDFCKVQGLEAEEATHLGLPDCGPRTQGRGVETPEQ